jgi:dynein heavy chain 2
MSIKEEMATSGFGYKTVFEFFVSRVKKNLNIVLSLNYQNPKFVSQCASNPALFSKCHIIWSEGWSRESMVQVSSNELREQKQMMGNAFEQIIHSLLGI